MAKIAKEWANADVFHRDAGDARGADPLPEEAVHSILEHDDTEDDYMPVRGICNGLVAGAVLWGVVILALRLMA